MNLADDEMTYADFLDDDRFVLCLDMKERVRIIDTKTRQILIEHAFPQNEYGSLIHVDDDFFGIYHGGSYLLCRIVWEYVLPDDHGKA